MNYPSCTIVSDCVNSLVVAVTSGKPDNLPGCHWTLFTPSGKIVGSGFSSGLRQTGAGSALTAMKLGKAAARRYLARMRKEKTLFD